MQLAPGTRVGSFTIVAPLGAGGMGALYRARDEKLRREVAIKILREKLIDSREHLRRFEREARSASALNHPNIVTIFEVDEFQGAPFIAMELIEGVSLRESLKQGPLPFRKLLQVATQIADGLAAAHERGIVHRDLKPDNVMMTNTGLAKILDFGVARVVSEARSNESTDDLTVDTPAGRVVGTAAYMSPEQASGRPVDFRSDQFSLGSTLYELATGKRAFRRDSMGDTLSAIIHDEPEPIQRLNPRIPPSVCWIIERCLAKDANDRYASTRDLAKELQALRDRMTEPAPPTRFSVTAQAKAVIAIAAIVVLIAVGAIMNRSHLLQARTQMIPNQKFLAVLPFKDLSGRRDGQLFSQGFSEAVSARLGKYAGIQVIPPVSAAPLVSKGANFRRIAQELGATLLLSASVQMSGDELRVVYSLLDSNSGVEVAGDTLNGSIQNVFDTEDAVADAIARDLGVTQRPARTQTAGLETAHEQDVYLRVLGNLEHYDDERAVDAAIGQLRELTETAAASPLVHSALGRAYLDKYFLSHEPAWSDKALTECDRARALDPNSVDVLLTIAETQRVTGKYDVAINTYQRALALQPNMPEAAIGLAKAEQGAKRYVEAEAAFRHGIDLRPTWWSGYNGLGVLYLTRGRFDDAARQFLEVIRLNPENAWGYNNLGNAYISKGELDRAAAQYRKALSIREEPDAFSNLGYCYYFLGDYDKSASAYRKATQLRAAVPTYWANLGDACTWSTQCRGEAVAAYKKAADLLRQDLSVNPNSARAQATLAVCLGKIGQFSQAKQHIKRALDLEPENPTRMYQAARVANMGGNSDEALFWLRRALEAGAERYEIERDPEFANLRASETFRTLVGKRSLSQSTGSLKPYRRELWFAFSRC